MKRNINMRTVFWCSTIFLFAFNIIGILIFKDNIRTSANTLVASLIFIMMLARGLAALMEKNEVLFFKSNRYRTRRFHRYHWLTKEQFNSFYVTATIYFGVLPFYLPLAVFSSKNVHTLWCLLLLALPALISIGILIPGLRREVREDMEKIKSKEEFLKKEKAEQEKREELGRWK